MNQQVLFSTGLNEPEPERFEPTESQKAIQKARLLEGLQSAGDSGVSGLLERELVPRSATQRISDLRKAGYVSECEKVGPGSLYYLKGKP